MAESTRNLNITPEEIESGKTMAFVAYLIFFIPLLMDEYKKNKFVMFHTEQSIVLLISSFLLYFAVFIFSTLLSFTFGILGLFSSLLFVFALLFNVALFIIGVINSLNGKIQQLPLIGQFGEMFKFVK